MRMISRSRLVSGAAVSVSIAIAVGVVAPTASVATSPAAQPATRPATAAKPIFDKSAASYGVRNSQSVRNLQRLLISRKIATPGLRKAGATGNYFSETRISVQRWQQALGFRGPNADGIIGKASATRLGLRWVDRSPAPTTPQPPTSPGRGHALTPVQLKNVLYQAGFREPAIRTAWGLVMRESRAYPAIVSGLNSNGTRDHGLFQINDVHRSYVSFTRIYQPVYNATVAYGFTRGGVDFSAWGLGTTGWAGQLKKQHPKYWAELRNQMLYWSAQYPG